MSPWHYKIALASLGWIALTLAAVAQPGPSPQDVPLGDVWIASDEAYSFSPSVVEQTVSASSEMPTGDVWLISGSVTRTAEPAALAQRAAAEPDQVKTGSGE